MDSYLKKIQLLLGGKLEMGMIIATPLTELASYYEICFIIRYTFKSNDNQQMMSRLINETKGINRTYRRCLQVL